MAEKTTELKLKFLEALEKISNAEELEKIIHLLENAATNTIFNWQTEFAFFTISKAEN